MPFALDVVGIGDFAPSSLKDPETLALAADFPRRSIATPLLDLHSRVKFDACGGSAELWNAAVALETLGNAAGLARLCAPR